MQKKIIVALIVSVIITVIILFIVKKMKAQKAADAATGGNTGNAPKAPAPPALTIIAPAAPVQSVVVNSDYPIVYNKYSNEVKKLQWYLGVTQDGYIGPASLAAWKQYAPTITERFKIDNSAQLQGVIDTIVAAKSNNDDVAFQYNDFYDSAMA